LNGCGREGVRVGMRGSKEGSIPSHPTSAYAPNELHQQIVGG
jgi:hypothetical protein